MRIKFAASFVFVAFMLGSIFAAAIPATSAAPTDNVSICHKPGTSAEHVISVSDSALPAHLEHGDYEGDCAPVTPPLTCEQNTVSGMEGITPTEHQLGLAEPTSLQLTYSMGYQADLLEVYYQGVRIYRTPGLVSYTDTVTVIVPQGTSTTVTVVMTAPEQGSLWTYTVFCPAAP